LPKPSEPDAIQSDEKRSAEQVESGDLKGDGKATEIVVDRKSNGCESVVAAIAAGGDANSNPIATSGDANPNPSASMEDASQYVVDVTVKEDGL
jgi:hypothetical protein